jgi:hypothetical protein
MYPTKFTKFVPAPTVLALLLSVVRVFGAESMSLPDTIAKIKPAIVAVGTHQKTRRKVFIQESKESLLQKPSGISYAIPINYLRELLRKVRIEP